MITVTLFQASIFDGDDWPPGDLIGAIAWMQEWLDQIPEEFRPSARIEIESEGAYKDTHHPRIEISYLRPETAEEEAERAANRALARAQAEARERKQYEALKAKFG